MQNLWLRVEQDNTDAVFYVEDDGCGIAKERLPKLFLGLQEHEDFVEQGRSNMGIGLSVCRTIIKAHGSELKAGNRPGGGAVFSFGLEMEDVEHVE